MTQFATDFSTDTVGQAPAGWTQLLGDLTLQVGADAGALGGQYLGASTLSTAEATRAVRWDAPSADAGAFDFEILAKFRLVGGIHETPVHGFFGRMADDTTGAHITQYVRPLESAFGIPTVWGRPATALSINITNWVWLRVRGNGDRAALGSSSLETYSFKVWADGEQEPAAWTDEFAGSLFSHTWNTTFVNIGFYFNRIRDYTALHIDYFAVGTGGDVAPAPDMTPVAPTISGVNPSTITPGSTPTISGNNFGATPQAVLLSPTDDRTDVAATAQTIGGGAGNTSVPTTGVVLPAGATHEQTLYYFVQGESGEWNATGFAVTVNLAPTPSADEIFDATSDGFRLRFTTDADNGTAVYAVFASLAHAQAWTVSGDPALLTEPANSLAWGTLPVSVAGVQETPLIAGLGENQLRYYRIFHYGDVTA